MFIALRCHPTAVMKSLKSAVYGYVGGRSKLTSAEPKAACREEHAPLTRGESGPVQHTAAELREALVTEFPEIQRLCSDRYLSDVLSVPNRKFEYALNEKVRKALEWRREYGVDRMCNRFRYNMMKGVLEVLPAESDLDFEPGAGLLKLCKDGAFQILRDRDEEGHIILHSQTQRIDYHAVGVEAGIQYHVLIIESALQIIRSENGCGPESMILLADTSGPLFAKPPPIALLQGLVSLLQRAYPDRIHRIRVGPVNAAVRGLYKLASQLMSANSRRKIQLVGERPLRAARPSESANLADDSAAHFHQERIEAASASADEALVADPEKLPESIAVHGSADVSAIASQECTESVPASADEAPDAGPEKPPDSAPTRSSADVSEIARRECSESVPASAVEAPDVAPEKSRDSIPMPRFADVSTTADRECAGPEKPPESVPTHSSAAVSRESTESVPASADEIPASRPEMPLESLPMHSSAAGSTTADRECVELAPTTADETPAAGTEKPL